MRCLPLSHIHFDVMLLQLLAKAPYQRLLVLAEYVPKLCECKLLVLSHTTAALEMCPVVAAQIIAACERHLAFRYNAAVLFFLRMFAFDVSPQMFRADKHPATGQYVANVHRCP